MHRDVANNKPIDVKVDKSKRRQKKRYISEKLCFDFQAHGSCYRGDSCRFQHIPANQTYCLDLKCTGKCAKADLCPFAHSLEPHVYDFTDDSYPVQRRIEKLKGIDQNSSKNENKICYNFSATGTCPYGDTCIFRHLIKKRSHVQMITQSNAFHMNQEINPLIYTAPNQRPTNTERMGRNFKQQSELQNRQEKQNSPPYSPHHQQHPCPPHYHEHVRNHNPPPPQLYLSPSPMHRHPPNQMNRPERILNYPRHHQKLPPSPVYHDHHQQSGRNKHYGHGVSKNDSRNGCHVQHFSPPLPPPPHYPSSFQISKQANSVQSDMQTLKNMIQDLQKTVLDQQKILKEKVEQNVFESPMSTSVGPWNYCLPKFDELKIDLKKSPLDLLSPKI